MRYWTVIFFAIIASLTMELRIADAQQVTMALTAAVQNSASGQTVVFSGTLTNTGATAQVFLNTIAFTLNGAAGTLLASGSNDFYANVPGILAPQQTYTGELFTIALSSTAPPADYTGSVAIEGGTDIFAGSTLASGGFTVLSPAVTVVATAASASEFGPVSGTFTITRTGGTEIGLPVTFSLAGTAVSGSDYLSVATPATIASGSSSVTVTITPIVQQTALGTRSAILTLAGSTLYDLGTTIGDTVQIQDTPFNNWRLENFGSAANSALAGPTADWIGAGVPNLVAYALGINPNNPNHAMLPVAGIVSSYLTLSYVPNAAASDVVYSVEASTDLVSWSTASVVQVSNPAPGTVAYRYAYPVGSAPEVFMRLRVTPLDW